MSHQIEPKIYIKMTNASNYHVATQGKFKKVDFNVFKLMQEYFIYRRLKNKPEFIEVEEMIFSVEPTTYENTETGLELARTDFRNRKLTSKFLSMSEILN